MVHLLFSDSAARAAEQLPILSTGNLQARERRNRAGIHKAAVYQTIGLKTDFLPDDVLIHTLWCILAPILTILNNYLSTM
jgi:hypothetical protein